MLHQNLVFNNRETYLRFGSDVSQLWARDHYKIPYGPMVYIPALDLGNVKNN